MPTIGINIHRLLRLFLNFDLSLMNRIHQVAHKTFKHQFITMLQSSRQVLTIFHELQTQRRNLALRKGYCRLVPLLTALQMLQVLFGSLLLVLGIFCSLLCGGELHLEAINPPVGANKGCSWEVFTTSNSSFNETTWFSTTPFAATALFVVCLSMTFFSCAARISASCCVNSLTMTSKALRFFFPTQRFNNVPLYNF